jgi:hypothetical protein
MERGERRKGMGRQPPLAVIPTKRGIRPWFEGEPKGEHGSRWRFVVFPHCRRAAQPDGFLLMSE